MPIFRMVMTTTVLFEAKNAVEAADVAENTSMEEFVQAMDTEDMVGATEKGDPAEVPPEEVQEALEAVGNDGTFFGDPDEEEDKDGDDD